MTATCGEACASDLEWLAAFREAHDDVAVMAKAQRPYAYLLRDDRTVYADDLHGLRGQLDEIFPPPSGTG